MKLKTLALAATLCSLATAHAVAYDDRDHIKDMLGIYCPSITNMWWEGRYLIYEADRSEMPRVRECVAESKARILSNPYPNQASQGGATRVTVRDGKIILY